LIKLIRVITKEDKLIEENNRLLEIKELENGRDNEEKRTAFTGC
jgi:hypothetical protein